MDEDRVAALRGEPVDEDEEDAEAQRPAPHPRGGGTGDEPRRGLIAVADRGDEAGPRPAALSELAANVEEVEREAAAVPREAGEDAARRGRGGELGGGRLAAEAAPRPDQ